MAGPKGRKPTQVEGKRPGLPAHALPSLKARNPVPRAVEDKPRIIVNAKVYPQVTGPAVHDLAEACHDAAKDAGTIIGLAPPTVELATLGRHDHFTRVAVMAQHVDALKPGAGTGWVTVEAARAAGAVGSLLNHAEHKIPHAQVAATVARLHEVDLWTCLCADSMAETEALSTLKPTYLAVEPPQLIGGDISVTKADPAIVSDAAAAVRRLSPHTLALCGAGVKTGKDVTKAIELGAYGVLLASGVVKHERPYEALADLCSGLP